VTSSVPFIEGDPVAVQVTQPLDRTLDYAAPAGGCVAGSFVEVPLGPRRVVGVVWGRGSGEIDRARIRPVARALDVAPMRAEMRDFLIRAAGYTLTPMHAMLAMACRSPALVDPSSTRRVYRRGQGSPDRLTDARKRVLAALDEFDGLALTLAELARAAGVSPSVIKGLVRLGVVSEEESPRDLPYPCLDPTRDGYELSPDQAGAADDLRRHVRGGEYGTILLRGVTGSGKTEVYLEAIAECLARERQALVLLPEIALTAEFLKRVERRFGGRPAEWHSGLTMTERRRAWRMVGEHGAQLVVGARSALFLPFRDLGLIVVDEEHDTSYKQEDGVLYNARDMAVLRASICSAQVILASATPCLESWVNAETGKYRKLQLSNRFGTVDLPEMRAVDMREEKLAPRHWVSPTLRDAVRARLDAGEQALLFLNRRGYAPVTICRACGHQIECDHCDARMVQHRFLDSLVCHRCGESKPIPSSCPSCGVENRLAPVGPGVERLSEEAGELFPDARIEVLSSDLFGSARALRARMEAIAAGEADIIIGTQLVAKGHDFPLLTLVGVIDADLSVHGCDLRAAERTFQLMRQVAGRAGRRNRRGEALLQTWQPEHAVIRAILAGDEEDFWRTEAAGRREASVPPYGRFAGIILSGTDEKALFRIGRSLVSGDAPLREIGARVYGPASAPVARIRGRHRVRLLVTAGKSVPFQRALSRWVNQVRLPSGLHLSIDIDPQTFY